MSDGIIVSSDAVIFTPGGSPRTLGVPGENGYKGRGVSYCATCDGDFFTDKEIVVVGGGNSALEEAVSLTKYASKVTLVHQFDHFQAFEYAIEDAKSNPKINFVMDSAITAFHGGEKLESVDIKNLKSGKSYIFPTDGTFIFIGYKPNTEFLKGRIELNKWGEIGVKEDMSTSIEGVYAAGDSITKKFRQVTTAVGDGTVGLLFRFQTILTNLRKNKNKYSLFRMQTSTIISVAIIAVITGLFLYFRNRIKNIPIIEDNRKILLLTDHNFNHQIKNKLVLIDFWASWCAPCRIMAPVLNEIADELDGNSHVGKVDIEKYRSVAENLKIRNIPTMILFKNGKEINRFVGVKSKDFLLQHIRKAL